MTTNTKENLIKTIRQKYEPLCPFLNERAQRIWAATEVKSIGWGGQTIVNLATGLAYKTIQRGLADLSQAALLETTRVRRPGGGRKKKAVKSPTLLADLESLVDPVTRGDPESPLRWTCKSCYALSAALKETYGHEAAPNTVGAYLANLGYSLQRNRKTREGSSHPDRNGQFEHINDQTQAFLNARCPVLSVDTKKKALIGNFKNSGQTYRPKGHPTEVNVHDFPDPVLGKAAPYGVYDLGKNQGWVSVGISADTAEFAVQAIRSGWDKMGQADYATANKILITADCGGSNGYRVRLWKVALQKLANELNKVIHVCHFPPGTRKWNKIEHRMFLTFPQIGGASHSSAMRLWCSSLGIQKQKKDLKFKPGWMKIFM